MRSVSVRKALFALLVGVALPLIALASVLMHQLFNAERNAVSAGHIAAVRTLAALVENEIETHTAIAASLASSRALAAGDLAAFHAEASEVAKRVIPTWIALSDGEGRSILSTLQPFGQPLPPRDASAEAARIARETRQPYVSDILVGALSGQRIALLEYPVIQNGQVTYTISLILNPRNFLALIENKISGDAAVAVIDGQRRFVARIPDHDNRVGTLAADSWRQAIGESPNEGSIESITLEGVASLTSYASTRYGWIAGLSYPVERLYAPVRRQMMMMSLIGAGLVGIAILLAYLFSRRLEGAIRTLSADARLLANGEPVPERRLPIREAQDVNRTLATSSGTLRQRLQDLEAAREHQTFLLRELAHRLKNQLAVINSMVRQTLGGTGSPKEFAEKVTQRTQGLAVGIDLLVHQNWQRASLNELVDAQLKPFRPTDNRLFAHGPHVDLDADMTQAVGLALHELATNALKYGAWSVPAGHIKIIWQLSTNGPHRMLHLTWQEEGGPPVTPPSHRGFGQVVIRQATRNREGSSSELLFEPTGVEWTLTTRLGDEEDDKKTPPTLPKS